MSKKEQSKLAHKVRKEKEKIYKANQMIKKYSIIKKVAESNFEKYNSQLLDTIPKYDAKRK